MYPRVTTCPSTKGQRVFNKLHMFIGKQYSISLFNAKTLSCCMQKILRNIQWSKKVPIIYQLMRTFIMRCFLK